jgi:preprotein translocase subunit SecY
MQETVSGFAALAVVGFIVAFAVLMLFMALVQPVWCIVDCAIDDRRGAASKVVWIIVLLLLWSVANWFYGAFAAANGALRRLTRLAWLLIIVLLVAFFALFYTHAEFRDGIKKEWKKRPEFTVRHVAAEPARG